jgi:hypothetical protein
MNLKNLRRALADPLARRLISKVDSLHKFVLRELGAIEDEVRQMEETAVSNTIASMLRELVSEIENVARRLR